MRKAILLILLLAGLSGCASLRSGEGGIMQRYSQSRRLSAAREMLAAGDRSGAARELTAIIEGGSGAGVTDEALFRLALLSLRLPAEREGNLHGLQLLRRLKKEYPASPWTVQSSHLLELLSGVEELRRQNKNLKGEVNELNRNIDQLKRLDQELEKQRH
jgi:uncharacterized protein YceK